MNVCNFSTSRLVKAVLQLESFALGRRQGGTAEVVSVFHIMFDIALIKPPRGVLNSRPGGGCLVASTNRAGGNKQERSQKEEGVITLL